MQIDYQPEYIDIRQDVIISSTNSSVTNLTSGSTFTGTATSTLGVNSIQVSLKTDENCYVYVDQSPDGTNWDLYDQYNYFASINNFGITVQAINSYIRVRVTNIGQDTTTYFRLQTVLCPMAEPLPRSLDINGNLKTAIKSISDKYDFDVENTPMGEMRTITPVRLIGANFEGTTINTIYWTATTANSATIAQASSEITLTSGTNSAGSAQLNTTRRARYVGGSALRYRAVMQLDAGQTDNTRKWGVAFGSTMPTITDGAYFKLDGTILSVEILKASSPTTISSGSFNGTLGAKYILDTNVKTYEIYWTNSKVYFVINDEILHTFTASTSTWSSTMSHYIYMSNINSGNTTSVNLKCRTSTIFRLGNLVTQPTYIYQSGTTAGLVLKYGSGNLHGAIVSGVSQNSVITLYDNTSATGTVIWSSGAMGAQTTPFDIDFMKAAFSTGLTLAITGANSNIYIAYE